MTERHQDTLKIFVAPLTTENPDGTLDRPYSSLDDALESTLRLRDKWLKESIQPRRTIEFVCVERPSAQLRSSNRGVAKYYVDAQSTGEADGTELRPWNSFESAIENLAQAAADKKLSLRPGQSLRISMREAFTATRLDRKKRIADLFAHVGFMLMAWACVIPVLLILGYMVVQAWPALSWEFLTTNPKNYFTEGGIWAPLIGTFFLVLLSLIICAPIGILAGVYLNEYARDNWLTRLINLAVVDLAGVPSIVHALFGVGAFVLFFGMGRSMLAASCTVAVMSLPVIITATREALAAVPMSFREACWNMGATRWQTIRTIVLPNSIPGILTGVVLEVARAAGETAPILFTGAVLYVRVADSGPGYAMPYGLYDCFMALSYHLFALSTQIRGAPEATLWGTAVVLIALVLGVNSISIFLRVYLRSRKKW